MTSIRPKFADFCSKIPGTFFSSPGVGYVVLYYLIRPGFAFEIFTLPRYSCTRCTDAGDRATSVYDYIAQIHIMAREGEGPTLCVTTSGSNAARDIDTVSREPRLSGRMFTTTQTSLIATKC